jgi:hypothetical protein
MAIIRPEPPPKAREAFATALPAFLSRDEKSDVLRTNFAGDSHKIPSLDDLGDAEEGDHLHDPQQIFVLGLTDVAKNAGAKAAKPNGWRFFAGRPPGRTVLGKVACRAGFGWKLTAAYYDDYPTRVLQAMGSFPRVGTADYELRVLAVPGLNLEVFWLAARNPKDDDLVMSVWPMGETSQSSLDSEEAITMTDFLTAIRPMALLAAHAHAGKGG